MQLLLTIFDISGMVYQKIIQDNNNGKVGKTVLMNLSKGGTKRNSKKSSISKKMSLTQTQQNLKQIWDTQQSLKIFSDKIIDLSDKNEIDNQEMSMKDSGTLSESQNIELKSQVLSVNTVNFSYSMDSTKV